MKSIFLIVKPTLACNSNCKYCYFKDIRTSEKMNLDIVKKILNKLNNYDTITWCWHGGEPLLMGIDWYREAVKIQKVSGKQIQNRIQTNLLLLNDEWIKFLKENNFQVSTSLDGIKEIHDKNRGNFDKLKENIQKLNENGIKPGCVAVVNEETVPYLYENFNMYQELNCGARINPQTCANHNADAINSNVETYGFILRFYHDLWLSNRESINFAPSTEIIRFLEHGQDLGCTFGKKSCVGRFPAILWNGDVIHCGRFVGTQYGYLGNVNDDKFSFGLDNPLVLKYYNMDLDRIKKCESCEYYNICHGGCFHHAIILGNGKDIYCNAYKAFFKHILMRRQQLGD